MNIDVLYLFLCTICTGVVCLLIFLICYTIRRFIIFPYLYHKVQVGNRYKTSTENPHDLPCITVVVDKSKNKKGTPYVKYIYKDGTRYEYTDTIMDFLSNRERIKYSNENCK